MSKKTAREKTAKIKDTVKNDKKNLKTETK